MPDITCPIVTIGASAGGLVPLKAFFSAMPCDVGAAYVVIQHLEPKHESLGAEILSRVTKMPTMQISQGMPISANHVYVIPPNSYLSVKNAVFELSAPILQNGLRLPIDAFLDSVAVQYQQQAIAIIISGTGHDGTHGLHSIKENGGLVFAQAPDSADYSGMPQSAIDSGLVDIVCEVEEMPKHLIGYLQHPYLKKNEDENKQILKKEASHFSRILTLLQSRTGHDFRVYKQGTLGRRISRRMSLHSMKSLSEYLEFLRSNDAEVTLLFKDLLIGVTAFFRDPDAFTELNEKVLTPLLQAKSEDDVIRVWVPGCSTGQEAYTIAILLIEQLERSNKHCAIQIFASDIDERALSVARMGLYPESEFSLFPRQRLNRFFTREDHNYRVNKALRDTITFATQNLISDPPFSNLDLITCRNLLIYLNTDIQLKVLALFHFALRESGSLLLGHSETCSQQPDLFKAINKKWRIYKRNPAIKANKLEFPIGSKSPAYKIPDEPVKNSNKGQVDFANIAQTHLLQDFAPAAVLVDQKNQVLHFTGPTSRYLEQPSGAPTHDILNLVRKEFRPKLRVALRKVLADKKRIVVDDVSMASNGDKAQVKITLKPIHLRQDPASLVLITFEIEAEQKSVESAKSQLAIDADKSLIQQIEDELYTTREDLQSNIEELESANEELQASNEEAMSVNEELQSSNEELESSKEELQSMNEELTTVNSQYKEKVDELAKSHDDISNLLSSTEIATIFIDSQCRIGRFTPATKGLLNLIATDIGRPLGDIRLKFDDQNLLAEVHQVMDKLVPIESEISCDSGDFYLKRILPYRTIDNRIDGVVITFIDITQRKQTEMRALRLATILKDSNDAVISLSPEGEVRAWNRGAEEMYDWKEQEALKLNMSDLVPEQDRKRLRDFICSISFGESNRSFDLQRVTKTGRVMDVWATLTPLFNNKGELVELVTTERDITQRKKKEIALRASEANFRALIESAPDALVIANEHGKIEVVNNQAEELFGYAKGELLNKQVEQLMPERFRLKHIVSRDTYNKYPKVRMAGAELGLIGITKAGIEFPIEVSLSPIQSDHGTLVSAAVRDISARKEAEDNLRKAKLLADSALKAKSRFLATASHDLRQPLHSLALLNKALVKSTKDRNSLKMLNMQNESLDGMSHLLNALLDISTLESGGVVPRLKTFSLLSLLELIAEQFSVEADEKGLHLDLVAADDFVFSDENLVKQLLQNLVSNAIRYTEEGSVQISARREINQIEISVKDTGIGIPEHELPHIFEEFHQVNRDPHLHHGGLGLGLAIVNRVATLLKTNINVVSTIGSGSTFSFDLPLAQASDGEPVPAKVVVIDPIIRSSVVLLIDDDASVLEASKMFLSTEPKLNVTAVVSPVAAYAAAKTLKPDLIISDYHLNDSESGMDVINTIRQQFDELIPAVVISGDTSLQLNDTDSQKTLVLIKPIDPEEMLSCVKQLLSK